MDVKRALLEHLRQRAPEEAAWSLRGGESGLVAWLGSANVKDIDLWVHSRDIEAFSQVLSNSVRGVVSLESDVRWLRHLVLVMGDQYGGQLVDITFGDLKVGGTLTCREALVTTEMGAHGPVLSGVAAVADLLMRKLLRGKAPNRQRLNEARAYWQASSSDYQSAWLKDLRTTFGARLATRVEKILCGQPVTRQDRVAFMVAATVVTLNRSGVSLMFRRRRRVVLNRHRRVLLKRPVAPVLFQVDDESNERLDNDIRRIVQSIGAEARLIRVTDVGRPPNRITLAGQLLKEAWLGRVVILSVAKNTTPELPSALLRYFGSVLRVESSPPGGTKVVSESFDKGQRGDEYLGASGDLAIEEAYYRMAHRWYIDDMNAACRYVASPFQADTCEAVTTVNT